MPQIKIHIDTEGNVKVETNGFKGANCKDATRAIEAALGKVESETLKSEYYLSAQADNKIKVNGGAI